MREKLYSSENIAFYSIDDIDRSGLTRTVFTPKEYPFGREGSPEDRDALCEALGISPDNMLFAREKHTATVAEAVRNDEGSVSVDGDYTDGFDALITREHGILLCTLEADCVPVWLFDPAVPAVAMIHSGWRGTASGISARTIERMTERYGTDPARLIAFIGPHICKKCYEVGPELKAFFSPEFDDALIENGFLPEYPGTGSDRRLLDLELFIRRSLTDAGVLPENIGSSEYCTYHSGLFRSYRLTGEKGKQMLTGIMLK